MNSDDKELHTEFTTPIRTIRVYKHRDPTPLDPIKDYDIVGTMVMLSDRYDLGSNLGNHTVESYWQSLDPLELESDDDLWTLEGAIGRVLVDHIIVPLNLYDHSILTMKCETAFQLVEQHRWKTHCTGWYVMSLEDARRELCTEEERKDEAVVRQKAEAYIQATVEEYSEYLEGNCYGITFHEVVKDGSQIKLVSLGDGGIWPLDCWGFIGYDEEKSGLAACVAEGVQQIKEHDAETYAANAIGAYI